MDDESRQLDMRYNSTDILVFLCFLLDIADFLC